MLACAESNFSNFKFEYLRENEFLRKTILACLSGAQMGSIHEKNRGRKSRDTAPLRKQPRVSKPQEESLLSILQSGESSFLLLTTRRRCERCMVKTPPPRPQAAVGLPNCSGHMYTIGPTRDQ